MGSLIRSDFAEIIRRVPEQDYDPTQVSNLFHEFIDSIANEYGLVYVTAKTIMPRADHKAMRETMISDIYSADSKENVDEKNYTFQAGNGGRIELAVGVSRDTTWTVSQETDIYTLVKTIYLMTGRAQAMHDLLDAITHDSVTKVANQVGMSRFMGEMKAKGLLSNFCANFLNIKSMKLLNERYHEQGGNVLLTRYAQAINEFVGNEGCVARLGGDNFFVVIDAKREEYFLDYIEKLRVDLAGRTGISTKIKMDSRVGYYYIQPADDVNTVMECAGMAIRNSRLNQNRDVVEFEPIMKMQSFHIRQLESNIPSAIENEEFVVYYQPKAFMSDDDEFELCGAEALVRWNKNGNIIPPNEFVPILEKNGMIAEIDFYVLEHVCQDLQSWMSKGIKPVKVSVNFSRRHLKYEDIADRIMAVVNKYGVNPYNLEIEITESYDDEDIGALSRFEQKMHTLGIDVSVDDFGSGFSNIKMIKDIVSDTIKLDKSIVDGVGCGSAEDDIIISHVIRMIRTLGKEVIAEGVETKEQAEFLRKSDCNMIQGFLYGRPMPKEEFEKILAEGSKKK